ncbi:MAG: lysylphosphatidylglycerol synthase domain-containing protein [Pseudohongiellaceae bacterium]
MNSVARSPLSALMWPALLLFMLGSLLAALHWYFSQDLEDFSLAQFAPGYLIAAVLLQVIAIAAVIVSWHLNLLGQGVERLRISQSLAMVGISVIGKYTPGKVWGLLARGAVLYRHDGRRMPAVVSALVEQAALAHSALILVITTFLVYRYNLALGALALALMLPSVWWAARSEALLTWLVRRLSKYKQFEIGGIRACYPAVCLTLLLMWTLNSAVLWLLTLAYGVEQMPPVSLLLLASILSYLGGFAAFFAPAGIGVREGLLVAMIGPFVGVSVAIYISLLQRLVTTGVDISLGGAALLMLGWQRGSGK